MQNDIPQLLALNEEKAVHTGLMVLHALVCRYEFEMEEDREPLFAILDQTFGSLGNLINTMLQHTGSEVALNILHLICKVFYTSNQLELAPFLCDPQNPALSQWIEFFIHMLKLDVPPELCSFTEDMDTIAARDKAI